MGVTATVAVVEREERERVEEEGAVAAAEDEEGDERRARLLRVVGPEEGGGGGEEEEEDGAVEVASARLRLRVSIQRKKPPTRVSLIQRDSDRISTDPETDRIKLARNPNLLARSIGAREKQTY